jgi:alkylhydroperoxidase family enzyme
LRTAAIPHCRAADIGSAGFVLDRAACWIAGAGNTAAMVTAARAPDVAAIAPDALRAFEAVIASARAATSPELYALARARIAALLGIDPPGEQRTPELAEKIRALPSWPKSPLFGERERACLAFTEQFVLDVSSVTPDQRAALAAALGGGAAAFVQALYAIDFELRLRAAFGSLFGVDPITMEPSGAAGPLWPALEAMLPVIARLASLDPLTSELVRLRGARIHSCRFCKSLRNVRAFAQGGGERTFEKVDAYEQSDLALRQKVALRLTDALLTRPGDFPHGLTDAVHAQFAPEQIVELLFDVARNALNKFAVAMGVDGAGVGDGIGYYDTDERGELVYGLSPS